MFPLEVTAVVFKFSIVLDQNLQIYLIEGNFNLSYPLKLVLLGPGKIQRQITVTPRLFKFELQSE